MLVAVASYFVCDIKCLNNYIYFLPELIEKLRNRKQAVNILQEIHFHLAPTLKDSHNDFSKITGFHEERDGIV